MATGRPVGRPRKNAATAVAFNSNPLVAYRAPRRRPRHHAPIVGNHFVVRRDQTEADTMLDILPGDFTYKADPTLELEFKILSDDKTSESAKSWFRQTGRGGFKIATGKDFEIAEHMQHLWGVDSADRICLRHGLREHSMVLIFRSGEAYDKEQSRLTRFSDDVQKTMEEKMAESAAGASHVAGNNVQTVVSVTDEDVIEFVDENEEE